MPPLVTETQHEQTHLPKVPGSHSGSAEREQQSCLFTTELNFEVVFFFFYPPHITVFHLSVNMSLLLHLGHKAAKMQGVQR